VLAFAWIGLQLFQVWLKLGRDLKPAEACFDLVFLYPSQAGLNVPGGALTHVTGFLSGLAQEERARRYFPASRYRLRINPHLISGSFSPPPVSGKQRPCHTTSGSLPLHASCWCK